MPTTLPGATWRPIARNFTNRKRTRTDAVILHVDAGNATSLFGWFSNANSGSSSHFFVKRDGSIEQYVDADVIAWTSGEGNARSVGVETQGYGAGTWTAEQCESLAKIIAWAHTTYGVPLTAMSDSKTTTKGIGWHRLGIDGNWPNNLLGGRLQRGGGESWSKARGKECPGDDRIKQVAGIITRAQAIVNPPKQPTTPTVRVLREGMRGDDVRALKAGLVRVFPTYAEGLTLDAYFSTNMAGVVREFQKRSNLDVDGVVGKYTRAALAKHGITF